MKYTVIGIKMNYDNIDDVKSFGLFETQDECEIIIKNVKNVWKKQTDEREEFINNYIDKNFPEKEDREAQVNFIKTIRPDFTGYGNPTNESLKNYLRYLINDGYAKIDNLPKAPNRFELYTIEIPSNKIVNSWSRDYTAEEVFKLYGI